MTAPPGTTATTATTVGGAGRVRRHVGTRMPGRDRAWRGTRTIITLAGVDAPSADAMRATLRRLAALDPGHRLFRRPGTLFTPARPGPSAVTRWFPVPPAELDDFCDRMVLELDGPAGDPDAWQRHLYDRADPDLPFRMATGDGLVAVSVEHPLLDGRPALAFLAELTARAQDGAPPTAMVRTGPRHPLATALAERYARDPRRLSATARARRDTIAAEPPGTPHRPWRPDFASASGAGDPAVLPALRRWRARNTPGVTRTAVLFAAARAALIETGLPPSPGLHVLADNRRYLPGPADLHGNFSVGVYLDPPDPLDPVSIAGALDTGLGAGRPLATMTLLAARAQLRRPAGPARTVRATPRPSLVLNYLGRLREIERVSWRAGCPPRFLAASTPGHPELVTFTLTEIMGRLQVSAAFHASTFDPALVRRAVDALCADPVGLLERAGAGRPGAVAAG
ncbi:hypothetical protein [Parafrankia discariae]|uniref:hypothetical protein n=1 Tax=Parafrankia discariae TaxID=365528 RepID=UPI0003AAA91D|nr:hypothetical protein [Parafrankia discariae]